MALFNTADIILPLKLMDSTWELQTVGALVESSPIPLLALALILQEELLERGPIERQLLKALSYLSLMVAIAYFILIPIAANSTLRINRQIDQQVDQIVSQQMEQIDQIEGRLSSSSDADIIQLLQEQGVQINNPSDSQTPKEQLIGALGEARQNMQVQTEATRQQRRNSNIKSAMKWIFGAVISGVCFFYIWHLTGWTRQVQATGQRRS
ncbi:MAG: hypothetical protein RLZZ435_3051 [Cyanobacteriota bacterium]